MLSVVSSGPRPAPPPTISRPEVILGKRVLERLPVWQQPLGAQPDNTPVPGPNNGLLVTTQDGRLCCLDRAQGRLRWSHTLPGNVALGTPLATPDGSVYVLSQQQVPRQPPTAAWLTALDADGQAKWQIEVPGWSTGPRLGADGALIVRLGQFNLAAVESDSGTIRWRKDIGGIGDEPVVAPDGTVYLEVSQQGTSLIHRWDSSSGAPAPQLGSGHFGGQVMLRPDGCAVTADSTRLVLHRPDGQLRWGQAYEGQPRAAAGPPGKLLVRTGYGYGGGRDGKLYLVDAANGERKLLYKCDSGCAALPVNGGGPAPCFVADGRVWCVEPDSATVLGKSAGHRTITAPPLCDDNGSTVYCVDERGTVCAYDMLSDERAIDAAAQDPRGQQTIERTPDAVIIGGVRVPLRSTP